MALSQSRMFLRMLPELSPENRAFWTGGAQGKLMIARCTRCGYYVHPPVGICPECLGREVLPEAVSGEGEIASLSVNYQKWAPDMAVPFAVAVVELKEQTALRLMTNIINCDPEKLTIGQKVKVIFEQQEDVFFPLFEPI